MSLFRVPIGVGTKWSAPLVVSATAIVIGAAVLLEEAVSIASTLLTPTPTDDESTSMSRASERHGELVKTSTDRFTGRSLFTMPAPPVRPAPPPPPPAPLAPPPPPPPPPAAPAEYSGAKPTGMLGDLIYFGETLSIRVGEEKSGIKVIGVEAPSNVLIEHARGSYSVPIWTPVDWSKLSSGAPSKSSSIIQPAPSTAKPTVVPATAPSTEIADERPVTPAIESAPPPVGAIPDAREPSNDERDVPDPDAPSAERVVERPTTAQAASTPALRQSPPLAPPATIPESLSQSQIDALTPVEAQAALARVSRARQASGLDQETQDRLRDEMARLRLRLEVQPGGTRP